MRRTLAATLTGAVCLMLIAAPTLAAVRVLKPYAHDRAKAYAKSRCEKRKLCKSAEVTECVRDRDHVTVECIVLEEFEEGPTAYCTYSYIVKVENGIFKEGISRPMCA